MWLGSGKNNTPLKVRERLWLCFKFDKHLNCVQWLLSFSLLSQTTIFRCLVPKPNHNKFNTVKLHAVLQNRLFCWRRIHCVETLATSHLYYVIIVNICSLSCNYSSYKNIFVVAVYFYRNIQYFNLLNLAYDETALVFPGHVDWP